MRNRVAAVALCVVALAIAPTLDRAAWAGDEAADKLMTLEKGMWEACDVRSYLLEDVKSHHINEETVVLTYKAQQDATCGGEKLDPNLLATSVWVRDGGQWQVASYQETPVAD